MNLINVKGSMSTASRKSDDAASDQFPAGLRVLVVDDDPTCLMIVERMLKRCHYEVTTCNRAEKALASLQANRNGFDIVISDVHMPDMDGFKLLELIGLEMDLPVIMMSADDGKSVVMKGVTHGACDYLIKPIRIEELKNIWQHVVRKRKSGWKEVEQSASVDDGDRQHNNKHSEDADYTSSATEGSWKSSKRRKDEEDEFEDKDDSSALKKPRVVWSIELHQQFVAAVNQLGIDKAVPKKIMELMNVPGLTRENVASHLQKYRLYLRRLSGVSHHHDGSFINPQDACFGPISGLDLQTLAFAGHLPLQASGFDRPSPKSSISVPLIDQRNTIFSFDNSKLRFADVQQQPSIIGNYKPMNLLHGVPTTMEPKQLASLHQMQGQTQSRVPQLPVNILQPNGSQTASSTNYMRFPMSLHRTELPGNSFPVMIAPNLTSKARYQEEVKGSGEGFMSANYMLDELQQIQSSKGWEFQNMGTTFDAASSHHNNSGNIHSCQTNLLVQHQQGLSSSRQRDGYVISNNVSGGGMTSFTAEGSQNLNNHVGCLAKVKSEVVPDTVGPALLFQDHFGQEDLMSVLLKQQGSTGEVNNEFDIDVYSIDNIS